MPLMISATAIDNNENPPAEDIVLQTIEYTDYERINQLKSMTDMELFAVGLTESDIEEIRNFSYENALLERAAHSHDELIGMGYTEEEIRLLKEYDGSPSHTNQSRTYHCCYLHWRVQVL